MCTLSPHTHFTEEGAHNDSFKAQKFENDYVRNTRERKEAKIALVEIEKELRRLLTAELKPVSQDLVQKLLFDARFLSFRKIQKVFNESYDDDDDDDDDNNNVSHNHMLSLVSLAVALYPGESNPLLRARVQWISMAELEARSVSPADMLIARFQGLLRHLLASRALLSQATSCSRQAETTGLESKLKVRESIRNSLSVHIGAMLA